MARLTRASDGIPETGASQHVAGMRALAVFALLMLSLALVFIANLCTGSVAIAPSQILSALAHPGMDDALAGSVIWKIRMPRLLAAAVLGGALSVSGYLLQAFFRNPMAGPHVLGISSGARMLVACIMVFGLRRAGGVPFWIVMGAAFVGSMLVTGLVLLVAGCVRSMSALLVVGIMMGSICSAVTDFLITFAEDAHVANLHDWSMGSFSGVLWPNLGAAAVVIALATGCAFLLSKPMSAYQLGESYARSVGVNVRRFRVLLIALSSVLSATVTALAGPISFVGIAVPHVTKRLFGTARPAIIIPGTFLLGGVFCMGCDLIARTAFSPTELTISTVTSVFGAPVVIALMIHRQRRRGHD